MGVTMPNPHRMGVAQKHRDPPPVVGHAATQPARDRRSILRIARSDVHGGMALNESGDGFAQQRRVFVAGGHRGEW